MWSDSVAGAEALAARDLDRDAFGAREILGRILGAHPPYSELLPEHVPTIA